MNTKVTQGGCLCGNVRYRIRGTPIWVGYCHCESCRRSTGAPAVMFVGVEDSDLEFIAGRAKIFESSPGVRRGFCQDCGTPLTYEADRFPAYSQVYVGTLDEPSTFSPRDHVHIEERLPWFDIADSLPRHKGSAADDSGEWKG